jgi:YVTN family beta-propeller protein
MPTPANLRPPPLRGPHWQKTLVVAVLVAAAACSGAADSRGTPRSTQPPPTPTGATVPAFDRGRFAAVIPVPGAATMAASGRGLWVHAAGGVVRIDPATNTVVGEPLKVPANAEAIAVGQGALWVTSVAPGDLGTPRPDRLTRIDLATGRSVATIEVPRTPLDVALTPGAVWVTDAGGAGDGVTRVDPRTNRVVGRPVATGSSPQSLAVGGGSLWVANHDGQTITRIDQATGKVVADIPVASEPHRVAYGAGAVWVGNWHVNSVSRIDPATNRVTGSPIPIGFHAGNLAVGAGGVWVTSDYRSNSAPEDVVVVRIDPRTNRAVETIAVGGHPIDVVAAGGAVWVSAATPDRVLRIDGP